MQLPPWPISWVAGPLVWLGLQLGVNKSFYTGDKAHRDALLSKCGRINIDASYHLYTRNVCRKRPPQTHYNWRGANRPEATTQWCNCDGGTDSLELLEREYLLVSTFHQNVIGIMPFPPFVEWTDEHPSRRAYLYDRNLFRTRPDLINVWWANRFHFGKLEADGRSVHFQHKSDKEANRWVFRFVNSDLVLDSVIWKRDNGDIVSFGSDAVAGVPTIFKRQPDGFDFGFQQDTDGDYKNDSKKSYAVRQPFIIYIDKYEGKKARYLVRFETMPDIMDDVAVASFDDPAVASSPEPLLDAPFIEEDDD